MKYAEDNGLLFMETSAKSGTHVNDVFTAIAQKLPKSEPSRTGRQANRLDLGAGNGGQGNNANKPPCC